MDLTNYKDKPEISQNEIKQAMDFAAKQIKRNLPDFTYACQDHSSVDNFYAPRANDEWTDGFWPGEIWLGYEYTGDLTFKYAGLILVESFLNRIEKKIAVEHHDMGFLYTLSSVAPYKLFGDERAKKAALLAADQLISRFQPVGEFIQAWGELGAKDNYRYIIDCLLNLPLLYWASDETGDDKYRDIALKHIKTCLKYSIREDGSNYHTVFMNPETGEMSHGATCQGYRDDSSWARGQAWAVYGTAISYRYTKNPEYLDAFKKVLDYYLARLPEDMVPYWDLIFTEGNEEPRDSSSASIVACGLLEMASLIDDKEEAQSYVSLAKKMMNQLVCKYAVKDLESSNGLVLHGTYSKKSPYNTCTPEGVDECVSWGDYYYFEALMRMDRDWKSYW